MDIYRRVNTVKITFDKAAQRPSALDVHKYVSGTLNVTVDQLEALQLLGPENAVYVKLISQSIYEKVLRQHEGVSQITFASGVRSTVTIGPAGFDAVQVRVFNLPMELPNDKLKQALTQYGTVYNISNETWSAGYNLRVHNGIRQVKMHVTTVIPSNILVAGKRAYVTYLGQEPTCFVCGVVGHIKQDCPSKVTRLGPAPPRRTPLLMSDLLKQSTSGQNPTDIPPPATVPIAASLAPSGISVTPTAVPSNPPATLPPPDTPSREVSPTIPMDITVPSLTRPLTWADDEPTSLKRQKISTTATTPNLTETSLLPPAASLNPLADIPTRTQEAGTGEHLADDERPLSITGTLATSKTVQPSQSLTEAPVSDSMTEYIESPHPGSLSAPSEASVIRSRKGKVTPNLTPTSRHRTYSSSADRLRSAKIEND